MTNEIEKQLNAYAAQIAEIPDQTARQDLTKMLGALRRLISEISRESVSCRRAGKETRRYRELADEYERNAGALEGYIIQAVLTYL